MNSPPDDAVQHQLSQLAHREVDAIALRRVRQQVMGWAQAEANRRWLELSRKPRWDIAAALTTTIIALGTAVFIVLHVQKPPIPPSAESSISSVEADNAQWQTKVQEDIERVDLSDGTLRLRVHRKAGGKRVVVRTPDGEIEDVGTTFHVVVRDGRTTAVGVDEGSVTIRIRELSPITLRAGETWERAPEIGPIEVPAPRAPSPRAHHTPRPTVVETPDDTTPASDTEREDAAYLEILQALRDGQRAHARTLAEAYLRNFPHGFRRTEVQHIARD